MGLTCSLDPVLPWLWPKPNQLSDSTPSPELPYAAGVAIKKEKKDKITTAKEDVEKGNFYTLLVLL